MKKLLTTSALALMSLNAMALEKGDWNLHLRAINIAPNDDSSLIRVDGEGVAGTGVRVSDAPSLDISLGYMITDNWAVEVLADLSSKHEVSAFGLGGLNVPDGTDVVEVNTLPPTVFLQYQFNPKGNVRPYAGLGVNFTTFLNDSLTPAAKEVLGASNLSTDNSWGLAAQFGIDWPLKNNWTFNVDVKYIDINTEATFDTAIGRASVDVDINPTVFGIGFGKTF
ncbi:outer membrane beta-barrel protein [Marinicella sp. S1101]|uniref:OmpW/AlkL family protein n=1 Tax=Marinicella marina TaxID=2996016 RepID=UPI002260E5D7|nr:OmpW family outer membrane protein [Marinicella marina]MCX7553141.1 outer membrane beta-barrel protein [Marinicella marina]MDJ1138873.1 OmpW family outer membrane protein [Marinicella marina]